MEQENKIVTNITQSIEKIKNKEHKIVLMVADTKGNAKASIAVLYRQAKALKDKGYNPVILTEKKDFIKVGTWLNTEFDDLDHYSIEENNLQMGPQDFMVIPEIFGSIADQIEKLPMEKIMFVQAYEYLWDPFSVGKSFLDYGIEECITTTEAVANLIKDHIKLKDINVAPMVIPDYFSPSEKPQKPVIAIHCRDPRKAAKIIKSFYLKYPIYKFIAFKDMHTMTEMDFAKNLKECCLSVWVDNDSSFGTFPIESIKCNVPVVGIVPSIVPEWMSDTNGIWLFDENQIVDALADYIKNWLEDNIQENFLELYKTMDGKYTQEEFNGKTIEMYESIFNKRIQKLEQIKQTYLKNELQNA